tara:strand:- start:6602 stop:6823 length:222 start_codon:yes stop_codon:yes gene_type:complete
MDGFQRWNGSLPCGPPTGKAGQARASRARGARTRFTAAAPAMPAPMAKVPLPRVLVCLFTVLSGSSVELGALS